jgi:hypothetical protein
MSDLKAVMFLAFIVFVTGCIGSSRPVTISSGDGLQINEFSADLTDVFSKEGVLLDFEVENVGGTDATDVRAKLFGGTSGWTISTPSSGEHINIGGSDGLDPPLPESNVAGEFDRKIWSITAPDLAQGLVQTYDIGVRVSYDYITTSVTQIDMISYDQFDQLRKTNAFTQVNTVTKNSNAPVKIELESLSPVRPKSSTSPNVDETVTLKISNVGSGVAFAKNKDYPDTASLGDVSVTIVGSTGLTCDFNSDGSFTGDGLVTLKRGFDTVKIPCKFTGTPVVGVPKNTVTVTITAVYSYAIDDFVSIKVTSDK